MQCVNAAYPCTGGVDATPLAVWPLIELELRGKDQRVDRDETKPIVSDFSVLGQ